MVTIFDIQRFANIYNGKSDTLINGTSGDDYITNGSLSDMACNNVTITAGAGNDTIDNFLGNGALVYGGDGNDYINTEGFKVTIAGGEGNDTITFKNENFYDIYISSLHSVQYTRRWQ